MVNKAARLEDIGKQSHIVWEDPIGTSQAEVWAPELHRINGKWYCVWSGWENEGDHIQNLYIAPMSSPLHLSMNGPRRWRVAARCSLFIRPHTALPMITAWDS